VKYQTAILIRSGCFEMPGLFGAVAALITGDISFLLFTAIVIVLFLLLRPSIYTITTDMNLTQRERTLLENPTSPL
jgi:membrane protein implicated in regulation of membrane protease activity